MANEHGRSHASVHADILQRELEDKTRRIAELEEAIRKIVKPTSDEKVLSGGDTIPVSLKYYKEAKKALAGQ